MPIKHIICQGIGFSPGSIKFMPTLGFNQLVIVIYRRVTENIAAIRQQRRIKYRRGLLPWRPG